MLELKETKFKPEYAKQVEKLCKLGAIDTDLADFFEVSVRTIHRWKKEHKLFNDCLVSGKSFTDSRVKDSLLHRALGYSHEHSVFHVINNEVVETKTEKHYPADTTACIFWLKNRCRDEFTESKEGNNEGMVEAMLTLAKSLPE